jgi:hypothetical protein
MESGYSKLQQDLTSPKASKQSKMKRLIAHLKAHKSINPKDAWVKIGIYRLGARIHDLRHIYDWKIKTEIMETPLGEEHAVYHVLEAGKEPK